MTASDLTAAVERLEKLAHYLVELPTDHHSRRPPHPYPGTPAAANRMCAEDIVSVLSALKHQATAIDREPAPEVWVRFADNGGIRMWKATPFEGAHRYTLTSGASDVR